MEWKKYKRTICQWIQCYIKEENIRQFYERQYTGRGTGTGGGWALVPGAWHTGELDLAVNGRCTCW